MKLDDALRSVGRLYLDASPLIYWVEAYPDYISKMDRIVDAIETTPLQALTSVLTLTEVMVQPLRVGNTDLARSSITTLLSADMTSRWFPSRLKSLYQPLQFVRVIHCAPQTQYMLQLRSKLAVTRSSRTTVISDESQI
ncbi:MAG: hypothetical protein OXG68_06530 [Chloroflexi bacterium]|nr:hypothetical protein [Chloroflexota bacterium]